MGLGTANSLESCPHNSRLRLTKIDLRLRVATSKTTTTTEAPSNETIRVAAVEEVITEEEEETSSKTETRGHARHHSISSHHSLR